MKLLEERHLQSNESIFLKWLVHKENRIIYVMEEALEDEREN